MTIFLLAADIRRQEVYKILPLCLCMLYFLMAPLGGLLAVIKGRDALSLSHIKLESTHFLPKSTFRVLFFFKKCFVCYVCVCLHIKSSSCPHHLAQQRRKLLSQICIFYKYQISFLFPFFRFFPVPHWLLPFCWR